MDARTMKLLDPSMNKTGPPNNCNTVDYVVKRTEQRVEELRYWRKLLQQCDTDLDVELANLKQMKAQVAEELQYIKRPTEVLQECIRIRESVTEVGDLEDEAERQTRKETTLLNTVKNDLIQKDYEIDDIIDLLEECKENLFDYLKITDATLLSQIPGLPGSTPGGPQQGPARPAQWNTHPQACEESSRFLQDRIKQELVRAKNLQTLTIKLIDKARKDMKVQRGACELAFRMRIDCIEKEKKRLVWLRSEKEKEIDILSRNLVGLEQALRARMPMRRILQESSIDKPPAGDWEDMQEGACPHYKHDAVRLCDEKKMLQMQMQESREKVGKLQKEISGIGCDLTINSNILAIGMECLKLRDSLNVKPFVRSPADWITGPMFRAKPDLPKITPYPYQRS